MEMVKYRSELSCTRMRTIAMLSVIINSKAGMSITVVLWIVLETDGKSVAVLKGIGSAYLIYFNSFPKSCRSP